MELLSNILILLNILKLFQIILWGYSGYYHSDETSNRSVNSLTEAEYLTRPTST